MRLLIDDIIKTSEERGLGQWSFSKLSLFETCPRAFQVAYLLKSDNNNNNNNNAAKLDAVPAKVGTFVHSVFEKAFTYSKPELDFLPLWAGLLKSTGLTREETLGVNTLKSNVRNLITRINSAICKHAAVPSTEQRMKHKPFICITDLVLNSINGKWAVLLDFKTHSRSPDRDKKVKDQLALNALLYFWNHPDVEEIKVGAVYVPDEDVVFFKVYRRTKDFSKLEQHWLKRCADAMSLIGTYQATKNFPIPKKKTPACAWCDVACKRNKTKGGHYGQYQK